MSHTIGQLQKLSDEDLIKEHDLIAKTTVVGTQYYMNELDRRSKERNEQAMLSLSIETQKLATRTYGLSLITIALSIAALIISIISVK